MFNSLPVPMQEALKKESLDEVNKVLGSMKVQEAEEVVEKLQMSGMMVFGEAGVRDMTGRDGDDDETVQEV
jgi:cell division cycle protein 37